MPRATFVPALLVSLLAVTTPPPSGHAVTADPKLAASVDAYLEPLIALDVFQGAVLIARGGRIVLAKGYGEANVELGVPNTPDRVFRIASLSKPFTQVALGRLVEQKRLSLSDPLSRFLPDFPKGDRITIDMLRTHRAGIPNSNSIPYDEEAWQPNTLDSLVKVIAREPLTFEPGTKVRYSNGGYALLGAVIEKASGRRYADYIEEAVTRPLGLTATGHEVDQMVITGRAYGYTVSPEERRRLIVAPFQEMSTKTGGGSLVSTVWDLHRFLRAMYRDNAIRAETWRTLFPPDSTYGYQGRCPGFNLYMTRDFTHDVDVVVLANNYAAGMVGTIGDDCLLLARRKGVEKPRWRSDLATDSSAAAGMVGGYRPQPGALPYGDGVITVRWQRGELIAARDGTPLDVLIPQGSRAFLLRNLWSEMRFLPGSPGGATLRPLWLSREPVPLERVSASRP